MPIWFSIVFWIIGIIVMFGGKIADNLLRMLEHKLEKKSQHKKFEDNSAHIVYKAGSHIVDAIPWYLVNTIAIVIGLVIIAIGFVPIGFHVITFS